MLSLLPVPLKIYTLIATALLGLVFGSFINCAAWRTARGESFFKGRSHCAVCGHTLSFLDLFPLFSFIFLRGRCRYCKSKISLRYPLTELFSGVSFVLILLKFDLSAKAIMYMALCVIFIGISLCDIDSFIIPDSFFVAGIINFIVFTCISGEPILKNLLTGLFNGLIISVPLLIIVLIADKVLKKESMGGADIKLFFVAGMYFPPLQSLLAVIIACIAGIIFAAFYNKSKNISEKEDNSGKFPFGPSICLAYYIVLFVGKTLTEYYLGLF